MTAPIEYRFVLPPGWVQIALDDSADKTVRDIARTAAAAVEPENRVVAESFLRDQLTSVVAQARANGGQDLYVPTAPVEGMPLPMSIVVSEIIPPGDGARFSSSDALVSFASRSADSTATTIDGQLAVRSSGVIPADDDRPETRRLSYLVCTPGPPRLMLITGAIVQLDLEGFDHIDSALELLFDSMTATIRFQREVAPA